MIVEHAFITTFESIDALATADELLTAFGFHKESAGLGAAQAAIELARGRSSPRKAVYRLEAQPQRVRVAFDRGRVDLAGSIEPHGKPCDLHRELLTLLATSVEERLTGKADTSALCDRWAELHERIKRHNRRRRLPRDFIFCAFLFLLLAGLIIALLAT